MLTLASEDRAIPSLFYLASYYLVHFKMWMFSLVVAAVILVRAQASGSSMTVYAMAVGQGDGNIILCPNGRDVLIVDMGAKNPVFVNRHYGAHLLKDKFHVLREKKNIHIVVTHPHNDHYNQLNAAIDSELVPLVSEIVLGGNVEHYSNYFFKWLKETGIPVYTINSGLQCFGNEQCQWTKEELDNTSLNRSLKRSSSGDPWQFCGSDVAITALGANIAKSSNLNMLSVILRLVYHKWSLLLSGDFEGKKEQKELVDRWPNDLQSTYYKVAHHGSWTSEYEANLPDLLVKIRPKRVYVSHGYPSLCKYHHPNCFTLEHLLAVGTIESVASSDIRTPYVCWNDTTHSVAMPHGGGGQGYAIYETCSSVVNGGRKQMCRDIQIVTDGYGDHTTYVDVPSQYVR